MAMRQFYDVKCLVNGSPYTVAEVNIEDTVGDIDISNTEGIGIDPLAGVATPGTETHMPGLAVTRITARNASFDNTDNPFAAPISIIAGTFIAFTMQPRGVASTSSWVFPSVLVLSTTHGGQIKQGQPVGFQGVSNGPYTLPTTSP